jgi:hypothetical protein
MKGSELLITIAIGLASLTMAILSAIWLPALRRRRDERRFPSHIALAATIEEVFDGDVREIRVSFPHNMLMVTVSDGLDDYQESLLADLANRYAGHDGLIIDVQPDLVSAAA